MRLHTHRSPRFAAALSATLLLAGCSGIEPPSSAKFSTVPAKGQVTNDGQPVADGILIFEPIVDGGSMQQATSVIEAGSFALISGGDKEGAMPGKYRVSLEDTLGVGVKGTEEVEVEIPADGSESLTVAF